MVDIDPLASMRCWAIDVELGGRTFEVPALPAVYWWPVLISGDVYQVLDLIGDSQDDIDEMILGGGLKTDDLRTSLIDAVEEAAGRSFYSSVVLASVARTQWAVVNGELVQSGFRWDEQPLGAALDALYAVIINRLEGDTRSEFLRLLDSGGPGNSRPDRTGVVSEFESMAGPRPSTGVVATGARSGSGRPRTRPRRPPRLPGARSAGPTTPPGPPSESGRPANYASPGDADAPASDTVPPPPPVGR